MDDSDEELAALIERCRRDHLAWVNGDASGYDMSGDGGVVLGAFGGLATGAELSAGQRAAASQFESGSGSVEVLDGGRGGDVAWLVMIERAVVRFSGHADPHRWELRVTEVFRRHGEQWRRVHRHADPLVERYGLAEVLAMVGR